MICGENGFEFDIAKIWNKHTPNEYKYILHSIKRFSIIFPNKTNMVLLSSISR